MDSEKGIIKKITELESSMKTAYRRMDGFESELKEMKSEQKILHEMNKNIAVLATNYENQGRQIDEIKQDIKELKDRPIPDVTELKKDVEELKEKPSKRWDVVVAVIITAVVTSIINFAFKSIFGG
jgi:predicted RNase H-like nuclease (RuvC/YqgF family)